MKKKYFASSLALSLILFTGYEALTFSSGAPAGNSGSPLSGGSCSRSGCHAGPAATDQSISITTDIPAAGFAENSRYSISIDADAGSVGSSRIGFMASVEDPSGHVGDIVVSDASRTQKMGSYLTHRFSGLAASNNRNTWSFDWDSQQAPDQSTVYVAVNYTNANGNTSGDILQTETLVLAKESGLGVKEDQLKTAFQLYPNPAQDYAILSGTQNLAFPVQLIDSRGKLQREWETLSQPSASHWELNLGTVPAGLYLLRDAEGRGAFLQKL